MDQATHNKIVSFIWGISDAWVKKDATKIGYEVSFTRHFYKPKPLRTLKEIREDIRAIEEEAEGLIDDLLATVGAQS